MKRPERPKPYTIKDPDYSFIPVIILVVIIVLIIEALL